MSDKNTEPNNTNQPPSWKEKYPNIQKSDAAIAAFLSLPRSEQAALLPKLTNSEMNFVGHALGLEELEEVFKLLSDEDKKKLEPAMEYFRRCDGWYDLVPIKQDEVPSWDEHWKWSAGWRERVKKEDEERREEDEKEKKKDGDDVAQ